jgi:MFS family permease
MRTEPLAPRAQSAILIGAATMLTLALGMRQSLGLFQPEMIRTIGITTADFSLAVAVQNMVWGFTQPFTGALVDRFGARWVAAGGALCYALGLLISIFATSPVLLTLGIGVLVGIALACTGSNLSMAITSRAVSPARQSFAMGAVSAAGSLGLVFTSAMAAFVALACVMIPAALMAGGVDRATRSTSAVGMQQSVGEALREATSHRGYLVMAAAFFVCGLQLVFLTTHLPTYLNLCGIEPGVTATALALIGLFNALGSILFGWLGDRLPRHLLLGGIYIARSLLITAYFLFPPTPISTLLFAAAMGAIWLGVVPLMNGLVIHLFGIRYVATLTGVAFLSHQAGSFLGAWGGGLIYSTLGSYEWAWRIAVIIGLTAGIAQMMMNTRPVPRVMQERAAAPIPVG